jgi:glycine cleavage system H protein
MASAHAPGDRAQAPACPIGPDLWCRRDGVGSFVIGLSRQAQERAGSIAHYRGPSVGRRYARGEAAVSLESEKWVGHLPLPVPGTVIETNGSLERDPGPINRDPYGAGWLYRMRPDDPGALEALTGEDRGDPAPR